MPKMRVGYRDVAPAFRAQSLDPTPHGHGNGYPYNRDELVLATTGANYPIVESAGMIKIVQDIEVPLTNSGTQTDWTTGDYTGLSSATMLPVFKYYDPADTAMKLNSIGNFYLHDAVIFSGTTLSGAAGLSVTPALTISLHHGTSVGNILWSWTGTVGATTRILRSAVTAQSTYGAIGNDRGESTICLRIDVSGANLPACRFRLVMLGFEF